MGPNGGYARIEAMQPNQIDIESMDVEQRLQLIEALWNSLLDRPEALPMTDAQSRELDRRLDEIDAGDTAGIPWDEVMSQLRKKMA